jgi:hypothetical protein
VTNTITPKIDNGNFGNQEDIYQSSNNSQNSSTSPIYEPGTEEPGTEELGTVYPQKWATGTGTVGDPWTNNCLNLALTNVPAGGTIFLRTGYYTLSSILNTSTKSFNLIGEGMGKSIIVLDVAHELGIYINTDYCTLKGFTIDGTSQTDGEEYLSDILIGACDYTLVEDIEVKNAGYYGINIWQVNHSSFQNIYAHDNYRHGMHPGSDTTGRNMFNTYRDIYVWNNGVDGFSDRGSIDPLEQLNNVWDNIQGWDNGEHGIRINTQKGGVLSNSFASGNGQDGIWLYNVKDLIVHDCVTLLNVNNGITINSCENVNLTNVISKNNHLGILTSNCNDITLTTCQSYDDRETPLQDYGIYLYETNTGISVLTCKLSPNSLGEIYNPAGAVVTVITEKMLAKF